MSRDRDRITKKMEKNPVVECNKIQKKDFIRSCFLNLIRQKIQDTAAIQNTVARRCSELCIIKVSRVYPVCRE